MQNDRVMTVHFNDGTRLSFEFPAQTEPQWVGKKMEQLLEHGHLAVEADGTLILIPLSSVKYLQALPVPGDLPGNVIKGASIVS